MQLLAGDHATKNSFDAVTSKLEQNLKAAPPLSAEPVQL